MAIDAGIYNQLKYPDPNGLSGMLDLYQQGKEHQVDRKNKLASLAQEQEMQSIQLDEAKGRQFFQQHLQTALEHSGGDLRKARDFAFQSGHPEGVAWAQQADKFIKEQEAKDRQNQFGDVVNSIGQPSVTSNQTEMLMQGGGNPSYTSMPETPEQRQQKMLKMLSINPEAGAQVAGVLNKPEEFRMKQAEARQARQDAFVQQENMARLVAGLKPAKEDNTLVAVIGPDGVTPTLVPRSQAGGMRPATGVNPDKPLTDSQSKALLFGSRMKASDDIIKTLEKEGTTTSVPGSRAPLVGGVVNYFSSANQQNLDQAKRDFINAVLRRESGAVISPSEFENGEKQYFPQIGDSDAVKKQKAANRNLAMRGVLVEVPEKHRNELFKDQNQSIDIEAILAKHGVK